ncbi:hypothetical protein TBLA_0D05490 [Henningerozyma blattae CBS 6284]|uniref:ATP-dependent RNA helicase n=1 Tax=Henningerozyma blattae (strain ATCC 34711 / CBS 6284 / DSM 70876 / NBRC 10599 / NRRL Y-10934 / UCD 77-7) TaxID=1071380 RepID=I2H3U0_HENB6|nr:hypothetical protein TBLA_0D05490 [Tetrapisispora blattae CBS 6284]CCH61042.1 hypothetical protein TBLA_0D05490 [Tetrapisispora blattae CBS 6284]
MSDDEGMLLNFTTDEVDNIPSNKPTPKIVGGSWRERRTLKMQLGGTRNAKKEGDDVIAQNTGKTFEEIQESMFSKDNSSSLKKSQKKSEKLSEKTLQENTSNKTSSGKHIQVNSQIVSSLFTSNRDIVTSTNDNARNESEPIQPTNAPMLKESFEWFNIPEFVTSHLTEKLRIQKPTSIQSLAIPALLNKKDNDLFIHAQTGSGKTLAYLLPILSKILNMKARIDRKSGAFAVIIAPTRELAQQIYQVSISLMGCCHYLVPCLLIGGESKKSEKARLRKGCNFIIGTPGRILDHLQNTKVIREQFSQSLRYIILDEGDKLMELGFEETISQILQIIHGVTIDTRKFPALPSRIVHILCSATRQGKIKDLGNIALKDYQLISSGKHKNKGASEEKISVPDQLVQYISVVPPKLRLVTLAGVLNNITRKNQVLGDARKTTRTIIFFSCADSVDFHYSTFSSSDGHSRNLLGESVRILSTGNTIFPCLNPEEDPNIICYKLHGSLSQQMRTSTLKHFSQDNDSTNGKHLILFCTDVASRGLDLPNIGTVIEFDPPFSVEDHLHRIGRTARAGQKGESVLFLLPGEEEGYMDYIKPYHPKGWKLLNFSQNILQPAFQDATVNRNDRAKKKPSNINEWDTNATTWHLNIERRAIEDPAFKGLAVQGYTSHVRAYATHISKEKQFFNIKFLHLGHLAKSFALRERPKSMAIQRENEKKRKAKIEEDEEDYKKPLADDKINKNKMWKMARMAVREAASEFNY